MGSAHTWAIHALLNTEKIIKINRAQKAFVFVALKICGVIKFVKSTPIPCAATSRARIYGVVQFFLVR